jgi:Lrp/AsnC family transcriptional regulator, leucine-responsive regulatory protein
MTVLDDIDATIMEILQEKGRTRRNDLTETVGLSLPSARERLRKREENGHITGYYATVDPKELGKEIFAFISVTVDSSRRYPQLPEHPHSHNENLE